MGQNFIPDTVNQTLLFPPSLHDWLPDGHLARFLADVVPALDLSAIYKSYAEKDGRGQAAYAPEMMVRLLLYGYARGVQFAQDSLRHANARITMEMYAQALSQDKRTAQTKVVQMILSKSNERSRRLAATA